MEKDEEEEGEEENRWGGEGRIQTKSFPFYISLSIIQTRFPFLQMPQKKREEKENEVEEDATNKQFLEK